MVLPFTEKKEFRKRISLGKNLRILKGKYSHFGIEIRLMTNKLELFVPAAFAQARFHELQLFVCFFNRRDLTD